jgi:hypothetical protein
MQQFITEPETKKNKFNDINSQTTRKTTNNVVHVLARNPG